MTPEQKAQIAAAAEVAKNGTEEKEKANAEEIAEEPIEGKEAKEAIEEVLSTPDYEALLKAESERAEAAEAAAAANAFAARKARREAGKSEEGEEAEGEDDKPLTAAEVDARIKRESQRIEKTALESAALQVARANTATEAEARAAVQFYKSRVVPTGNLEEDVLFAIGGLNRRRLASKTQEVARALRSKETALHSTAVIHREAGAATEPRLTPQDAQAIKQTGMAWDGKLRVYKKPLGNGAKHLFYDPKSKRRWTA